jgi:16S rRNA (adenine1518-N6/adenine1519-N6)-dimethyltransferase
VPPQRLGRKEVRQLLEDSGVRPTSSLGQNFVTDPNTVERIARLAAVGPGDRVLEIGAGLGSLSLALADTGAELTVVEIDDRLVEVLRSVVPPTVRVVHGDAMRADWSELLAPTAGAPSASGASGRAGEQDSDRGWVLVANLPYNIAATLVVEQLEHVPAVRRMLVMVQREVGERLAAGPGGKEYGAVSVRVAYFATARIAGRVSPEVFHPRPKVDSALVAIERRQAPAVDPAVATYAEILTLVRAGFAGRRKMLRRSLSGLVDEQAFELAGIAPTARAEELDVTRWGMLAGCQRSIETGSAASGRARHPAGKANLAPSPASVPPAPASPPEPAGSRQPASSSEPTPS